MMDRKYRHEMKYIINMPDWALLRSRLAGAMQRDGNTDANGEYWVRSLYFDDYWNSAYEDKENGVLLRHKYRLRVYDLDDKVIRLERKSKYGQYISKESAPLTREQAEMLLNGEYSFLLRKRHALLRQFYYECTSKLMRPRVIVDYDREPYILNAGEVRITFDKHVRAGFGKLDLFDPDLPTAEVLPGNQMIMEIKYTDFLPGLVRSLLPPRASMFTAASKYEMGCAAAVRDKNLDRTEGLLWKAR